MENYFESLKFRYSRKTGKIHSLRVNFTDEEEDSILITPSFFSELYEYMDVSENDKELFFVLAKAIQLSMENTKGSTNDHRVKKYKLRTPYESFAKRFVTKLMMVAQYVPMDCIANFFSEDAKIEDLDVFLNQKDAYELTLLLRDGIDVTEEQPSYYGEKDYF